VTHTAGSDSIFMWVFIIWTAGYPMWHTAGSDSHTCPTVPALNHERIKGAPIHSKAKDTLSRFESYVLSEWDTGSLKNICITRLHPHSARRLARQPSELFSNGTFLLSQPRDCSCYVSGKILVPPPHWLHSLIYAHMTSRTFSSSDVSLSCLTLPLPDAGDFVELTPLYHLL
jgi:hypothetical protein